MTWHLKHEPSFRIIFALRLLFGDSGPFLLPGMGGAAVLELAGLPLLVGVAEPWVFLFVRPSSR
jgi:hypothetical protein